MNILSICHAPCTLLGTKERVTIIERGFPPSQNLHFPEEMVTDTDNEDINIQQEK